MPVTIVRDVPALRAALRPARTQGQGIALVPTMGALHEGHLTLIRHAAASCRQVVVSIFVNPRQFGAGEDFQRYPRQEAADVANAEGAGATLVFAPDPAAMYPGGYATTVSVARLTEGLCGAFRPGHFDGVATVVTKLLLQGLPDVAFFGEKDYQQLLVIRRLVADLDIPVRIEGVPTVREPDGLALSSRNVFLSPGQRRVATALPRTLAAIAARLAQDGRDVAAQEAWGLAELRAAGFDAIDYLELRDADTLAPIDVVVRPARVLAAVRLGTTRLIDNMPILPPEGVP
ncbi:pantoate--beta-alanine ligase [Rhodovastum atsumiense]|uniref:pantoate--beta-alanine ligase n=1 Tax=Rhodovastum atsumiense TaxID=504468 RepID=UPI002025B1F1|nr:pantoate--beta-alanine ligase [Rhodovastum atsumiense]